MNFLINKYLQKSTVCKKLHKTYEIILIPQENENNIKISLCYNYTSSHSDIMLPCYDLKAFISLSIFEVRCYRHATVRY